MLKTDNIDNIKNGIVKILGKGNRERLINVGP